MIRHGFLPAVMMLTALLSMPALADAPPDSLETVVVTGRAQDLSGIAESANQGVVSAADLSLRPLLRPGEVVEEIPGVIITQHSGSGKANQYFLRGFNLDHGTDLAVSLDGVPVNMPSHAHGQGYADLNFLIPGTGGAGRLQERPLLCRCRRFRFGGRVQSSLLRRAAERFRASWKAASSVMAGGGRPTMRASAAAI